MTDCPLGLEAERASFWDGWAASLRRELASRLAKVAGGPRNISSDLDAFEGVAARLLFEYDGEPSLS